MPTATFTDSRFRLDYSVTTVRQEIENNRSLIRRVLTIVKTGSSYAWASGNSTWEVVDRVGSTNVRSWSGTFSYNFGNYSSLTLMDRQDWVTHNADGTYSFLTTADVRALSPLGNASTPWHGHYPPQIPRATTPTVSGGFTTGVASTINLPRASSSFTHDVTYKIGSLTGTIATGAGASASWTPPHTLMTALPNAASGTVEITVVTKNGSSSIGTKKINVTLTAAASIVPTISGVAWEDDNPTVVSNIGAFVQGLSLVKGTVTAAGVHGSTITSKRILLGGQSFAEGTAFIVNGSGTVTAQGEATDSRGRTTTADSSFTVLPYLPPQIGANGWQVRRANSSNVPDDNGQYLRVDLHAVASSLKPASTEKNALTIQVRTKASDAGWVNRNTINPGITHNTAFQVSGGAAFSTTKSYEVEITITDKTGAPAVMLKTTVGTAVVTLDLNGDKVGVGKMHEFGTLDVAGDVHATGKFFSNNTVMCPVGSILEWPGTSAPTGWLLCHGQAVSRTTYAELFGVIGTEFGSGNGSTTFNLPDRRGRVGVGVSSDTEFNALGKTFGTKTHTLTTAEMPSHDHGTGLSGYYFHISGGSAGRTYHGTGGNRWVISSPNLDDISNRGATGTAGGGGAHNNIQPSVAMNYIIRAL